MKALRSSHGDANRVRELFVNAGWEAVCVKENTRQLEYGKLGRRECIGSSLAGDFGECRAET